MDSLPVRGFCAGSATPVRCPPTSCQSSSMSKCRHCPRSRHGTWATPWPTNWCLCPINSGGSFALRWFWCSTVLSSFVLPDGSRAGRSRTREGQDPTHDHTNCIDLNHPPSHSLFSSCGLMALVVDGSHVWTGWERREMGGFLNPNRTKSAGLWWCGDPHHQLRTKCRLIRTNHGPIDLVREEDKIHLKFT